MGAPLPKAAFDRKFQTKLVRVLFQAPEESRDILENIDSTMFDTAPAKWTIRKLKWALKRYGVPATLTLLEHEAVKDASAGTIREKHVDAFASFLDRVNRPVKDRGYILDEAFNYIRFVSMREFLVESAQSLQHGEIDWAELDGKLDLQRRFGERVDGGLGQDFFADTDGRVKRRKHISKIGIPTGIGAIDEKMRQKGLPRKQLGVIIAPPGRGKTAMLVFIAGSAVLCGYKVVYISLELDEDVIAERFDARFSGIILNKLEKKPKTLKKRLRAVVADQPGAGLRIKEFPAMSLTIGGLRSYLSRLESVAFYPDLVLIDYLDNMNFDEFGGRGDTEYTPLGRLYTATRGLASERNIPIWTASQSNRLSIDKKVIGIEDLADSFKKAAVSDVMIAIAQGKKEMGRRMARLCMAKNRNGMAGTVDPVRFDTARVHVTDL